MVRKITKLILNSRVNPTHKHRIPRLSDRSISNDTLTSMIIM